MEMIDVSDYARILNILERFQDDLLPLRDSSVRTNISMKLSKRGKVIACISYDEIVGFVAYYDNNTEVQDAYITLIAVDPKYRNRHIGKRLLSEVEKRVSSSMHGIRLEVQKENIQGISFYAHNGYEYLREANDGSFYMLKSLRGELT